MSFFSKAIENSISLLIFINSANASGLQLFELTGILAGNAGAGDAARADDASNRYMLQEAASILFPLFIMPCLSILIGDLVSM